MYTGTSYRVDAETCGATVDDYSIDGGVSIWSAKDEPTTWIVELTVRATASIDVSVEFFAWDSIDEEELSLGAQTFMNEEEVKVDVFLTCSNVHLKTEPSEWETDIEIADGSYSLEAFEVNLDYGSSADE